MALNYSFPGPSGLADSIALRKDLAGIVVRDSAGVVRGGVFPRHAGALITARSDMRVNVLPFEGITVRSGGPLFIANDGSMVSPALATAPTSNARIDLIYFKQNESALADADNLPFIGVVTGTAAADPQKPALTVVGAEELGTVYIPSTATATNSSGVVFTPTHRFTAAAGGTLLFRTPAERDAFAGAPGQHGYALSDSTVEVYSSAGWATANDFVRGGTLSATTSAGGDLTITFPVPFPTACLSAIAVDSNTGSGIGMIMYKTVSRSRTGCVVRAVGGSGVIAGLATSINYMAFGS